MTPTQKTLSVSANKARSWALICYALYGLGVAVFFSLFVAIALNYWLKPQVKDSIVESHVSWQIRTFWFTCALMITGIATAYINLGYLFIFAGALLLCLRTIWGAIQLYRYRPM
jgi:uncharacterized membrane protein